MEIKSILRFKNESIFDGAVQIDWFYDNNLRGNVASSYIFHGPKYFGLSSKDISTDNHKLIDTASFIKNMSDKIYLNDNSNRFILTIAGYGAGKSHLGVTMSALFSDNDNKEKENILNNIKEVDEDIYNDLKHTINRPNLVIALNGMKNFNLNNEILKNAQQALQLQGQDTKILEEISTSYKTAEQFLNSIYDKMSKEFMLYASKSVRYKYESEKDLKSKLLKDIYEEQEAFEIIDNVYREVVGHNIRWDDGVSASSILSKLNEEFCEKQKIFNKIILIFDEFGRFLEYASAFSNQAGDAALQQIFEAIQNANKNILFLGFIQSDLSAYISRVENPNIARYVGRYDRSDKYYLSSNLETVLANLIVKDDPMGVLEGLIDRKYTNYHINLHTNLNRWLKESNQKSVWSNKNLYNKVILKGCYPFHPITVWMLSTLSTWMQQRSTLNFASEIFDKYKDYDIYYDELTYIYPTEIIKSGIFNELLNAEEKGIQQSQYCLLYNEIIVKYGDKLIEKEKEILQAILVANICKFKVHDKEDYKSLLKQCSGYDEDNINSILKSLEEDFGIIRFDLDSKTYDFMAEGNGKNDFLNEFKRKKNQISTEGYIDVIDDKIKKELDINIDIETPFGIENNIISGEWRFSKRIIHINNVTEYSIKSLIREQSTYMNINTAKGILMYVYSDQESYMRVDIVKNLINKYEINKYPIIFILINDSDNTVKNRLIDIKTLREFTQSQREKYNTILIKYYSDIVRIMVNKFKALERDRKYITGNGIEVINERQIKLCNESFFKAYTKIVPFAFDGFGNSESKATITKSNGYLIEICKGLLNNSITKKEGFLNLSREEQNRAKSVLSVDSIKSWKVMSLDYLLIEPQHTIILEIVNEVIESLETNTIKSIDLLFRKYMKVPYNFNINSLALLISYFIGFNRKNINIYQKNRRVKISEFIQIVFEGRKVDLSNMLNFDIEYKEGSKEDVIDQLLDKIKNNIYVEKCEEYSILLKNIEKEEEIPENLNSKLYICRMKLERGRILNNQIYSSLNDSKNILNECKNGKYSLIKLTRVYKNVNIDENTKLDIEYHYYPNYLETCKELLNEADKLIEDKGIIFIKRSVSSKNQENFYKNINLFNATAKNLEEIGKIQLANMLKKRVIEVKKEIELTRKYEENLSKFRSDYRKIQEYIQYSSYHKLENSIDTINSWIKFFNSNDELTLNLREESLAKLNYLKINVGKTLDTIESEVKFIELQAKQLCSIDEVRVFKKSIIVLIENVKESKLEINLNKKLSLLEDIEAEISYIDVNKSARAVVLEKIKVLEDKYSKTYLSELIAIKKGYIENYLDELEDKYIADIKENIEAKIINLDYKECMINISKLSNLPLFAGYRSNKVAEEMKKKLDSRINENKLETIISMFNDLDKDSKIKCIKEIENIIENL